MFHKVAAVSSPLLFLAVISSVITPSVIVAQQNVTNSTNATSITPTNLTGLANLTVLTSANGTAFNPLTGLGELMFVGQVLNNDTIPSNSTNMTTQLFDFNGNLVGFGSTTVPALAPGAIGNFEQKFTDLDLIGGTPNAVFYEHDTNEKSLPFFGFIPPPFLAPGVGGALAAGGALGSGGGLGVVGGGGVASGGGGGGGGGDLSINNVYRNIFQNCIINQSNVGGEGGGEQSNIAVCNQLIDSIQQQQQPQKATGENKTTPGPEPTIPATATEGPDESCLFDASQPRCAPDESGNCPDGFNMNEDGNCYPEHSQCPDGYHSEEDDETGQCYPDSQSCSPGYILSPDFPTCEREETVCEKHPELNECTDFLNKQAAITSNDDNQTQAEPTQQQEPNPATALTLQANEPTPPPEEEPQQQQQDEPQQQQDEPQQQQEEDNGNN